MSVAILKIISYWNPIESEGSEVIIKWCHPHVLHCISLPAKTSNCCYVPRGRWYSQPFLGAGKLSFPVLVRPLGAADVCSRLFILPLCVGTVMEKRALCPVGCLGFFLFLKKTISINHCKSGGLMWFNPLGTCIAVLGGLETLLQHVWQCPKIHLTGQWHDTMTFPRCFSSFSQWLPWKLGSLDSSPSFLLGTSCS